MVYIIIGLCIALVICIFIIIKKRKECKRMLDANKKRLHFKQQELEKQKENHTHSMNTLKQNEEIKRADIIKKYEHQIEDIQQRYKKQINDIQFVLKENAKAMPEIAQMLADYSTLIFEQSATYLENRENPLEAEPLRIRELREKSNTYIEHSKILKYFLDYMIVKYPDFKDRIVLEFEMFGEFSKANWALPDYTSNESKKQLVLKIIEKHNRDIKELLNSRIKSIPHIAALIADFLVLEYKETENYFTSKSRPALKKALEVRELKKRTRDIITENKIIKYQIDYIKEIFPVIEDVLEVEFSEIDSDFDIANFDPVRNYISKEEWDNLDVDSRNQLALDNYISKRKKNNWQVGRDYELSTGYEYENKGYSVEYFGTYMGLADFGRDLIAKKNNQTKIIQCKYWAKYKEIHEKHINQLFGTMISYSIENNIETRLVKGVFVTSTKCSETAKKFADRLNIEIIENKPIGDFPRIKCNIGKDEQENITKIYHLPIDQQYDKVKLNKPGECFVYTVDEAVEKGFRRAWRWHGQKE